MSCGRRVCGRSSKIIQRGGIVTDPEIELYFRKAYKFAMTTRDTAEANDRFAQGFGQGQMSALREAWRILTGRDDLHSLASQITTEDSTQVR